MASRRVTNPSSVYDKRGQALRACSAVYFLSLRPVRARVRACVVVTERVVRLSVGRSACLPGPCSVSALSSSKRSYPEKKKRSQWAIAEKLHILKKFGCWNRIMMSSKYFTTTSRASISRAIIGQFTNFSVCWLRYIQ